MRDLLSGWVERDYAEGTVAGVLLDAWLREVDQKRATDAIGPGGCGMPQTDELWAAAERAGVLTWDACEDIGEIVGDELREAEERS